MTVRFFIRSMRTVASVVVEEWTGCTVRRRRVSRRFVRLEIRPSFFEHLRRSGYELALERSFPDHHVLFAG